MVMQDPLVHDAARMKVSCLYYRSGYLRYHTQQYLNPLRDLLLQGLPFTTAMHNPVDSVSKMGGISMGPAKLRD